MCEATCVVNQLQYLRDDLVSLAGTKIQALAVEGLQGRIDGLIRQLDYFNEGQSWANPDSLLAKATVGKKR